MHHGYLATTTNRKKYYCRLSYFCVVRHTFEGFTFGGRSDLSSTGSLSNYSAHVCITERSASIVLLLFKTWGLELWKFLAPTLRPRITLTQKKLQLIFDNVKITAKYCKFWIQSHCSELSFGWSILF